MQDVVQTTSATRSDLCFWRIQMWAQAWLRSPRGHLRCCPCDVPFNIREALIHIGFECWRDQVHFESCVKNTPIRLEIMDPSKNDHLHAVDGQNPQDKGHLAGWTDEALRKPHANRCRIYGPFTVGLGDTMQTLLWKTCFHTGD